ncbi:FkbM family methyltransferase [Lacibacter cauensis]|uniref:FkbM family methyltransferase n=1 Tax=Lacibacter cauensis TaxID=510947 RepID=A0A562SPZ8_9BACT|nr:FkbM family methyltransferase [Lacibacter cauensis]TWI83094.1 FkbM family methyltransferase [Lacibacter cauensis]
MLQLFNTGILLHLKRLVKKLPVSITRNQLYDQQTKQIIRLVCKSNSHAIDVGTHYGEILDVMLQQSPNGMHFGFEPLPLFYHRLKHKYSSNGNVQLFDCALSNRNGATTFNYVTSNPSYSGIKKRNYDRKGETDTEIIVQTARLDDLLQNRPGRIAFIKIDVEGAELDVLKGAEELIKKDQPVIVFECGIGGTDVYDNTPAQLFQFFETKGYKVSLLHQFMKNKPALNRQQFEEQYYKKLNYYFVAAVRQP